MENLVEFEQGTEFTFYIYTDTETNHIWVRSLGMTTGICDKKISPPVPKMVNWYLF